MNNNSNNTNYNPYSSEELFLKRKIDFINKYKSASNNANSTIDDNSNIANKNIALLNVEIHKEDNLKLSRKMIMDKLKVLYPDFPSAQYSHDLESHILYKHDENQFSGAISPYCVACTLYPFLSSGIRDLGGLSASPKNLKSFCGILCNAIFAISSQFAGAVAVSEALLYFTYFCKKEWGEDFYKNLDLITNQTFVDKGIQAPRTILSEIHQYWQQIVYTINQPAAARGFQSAFVNFSYFDRYFFEGMFGNFYFPDGTQPDWESLNVIQQEFMKWFNEERKTKEILTFPVESFSLLYKDGKFQDGDSFKFVCDEYERGHSFFTYISDTVDSLSSCCFKGDEVITIYNKDGNKRSISIEEFVNMNDSSVNNSGNKLLKDDYYIDSYNGDGSVERVKITGTLKKSCDDSLYQIEVCGKSISVTGDHIIMVKDLEDNEIKYIPAEYVCKSPMRYLIAVDE